MLLIDMNLSPRWVQALAGAGIESVHWADVGSPRATDAEIMAYAAARGDTVLTADLDFGDILAASGERGPSVVQLRADDLSPEVMAPLVIAALRQAADALGAGALLSIDAARSRLRVLPLRRHAR